MSSFSSNDSDRFSSRLSFENDEYFSSMIDNDPVPFEVEEPASIFDVDFDQEEEIESFPSDEDMIGDFDTTFLAMPLQLLDIFGSFESPLSSLDTSKKSIDDYDFKSSEQLQFDENPCPKKVSDRLTIDDKVELCQLLLEYETSDMEKSMSQYLFENLTSWDKPLTFFTNQISALKNDLNSPRPPTKKSYRLILQRMFPCPSEFELAVANILKYVGSAGQSQRNTVRRSSKDPKWKSAVF